MAEIRGFDGFKDPSNLVINVLDFQLKPLFTMKPEGLHSETSWKHGGTKGPQTVKFSKC